jgi:RNA-directed DNA polymerase
MDVAQLISALLPLLASPRDNADAILELLGQGRRLADYEVARFVVAKRTEPMVRDLLASADPTARRSAVRWVEMTFARGRAAAILRDATKDRAKLVRPGGVPRDARAAPRRRGAPDTRSLGRGGRPATPERHGVNPFTRQPIVIQARPASSPRARFDPSGWGFGLFAPVRRALRSTPAMAALQSADDVLALVGLTGSELAPLETHPAAHGFVPGRSTVTNARPHVGATVVLKMDLVDFFPSIHFGRLCGLFRQHGAGSEAARLLAALVTYRPILQGGGVAWPSVLPQGAPTSPALSNLVCRRLDARLAGLASRAGAVYTRYADDLTFSFRAEPTKGIGRFAWWVNQITHQEGFIENLKKRRVLRPSGPMRVTGLVTNEILSVPRSERRRFRAMLHDCSRRGVTAETTGHADPRAYLLGFAAYLSMVDRERSAKVRAEVDRLLSVEAVPGR